MPSVVSTVIFCFVTVALTFRNGVNSATLKITRGEHDYFTNITDCHKMNAIEACVGANIACPHCSCRLNETFVTKQGQYGKCIDDNRLGKCVIYFKDDVLLITI